MELAFVLLVVAAAAAYLLRGWLRGPRPGAGGCEKCGGAEGAKEPSRR